MTAFATGNRLVKEGKLEEAIASYQMSIEANPQFAYSYQNLANVLEQVGRIEEAIAALRQVVAINPQAHWSFYKLGVMLGQQGEVQEGVDYLRQAIELKQDVPEFYLGLASGLVKLGQCSEAENCINEAMGMLDVEVGMFHGTSLRGKAYFYLAEAKSGQQQWLEAVDFYQRSWEVNPGRVDCCIGWAKALGKLERWEEAVELYRRMVVLSGESGEVLFGLGQVLGKLGRWEEAVVEYRGAISLGFAGAKIRHHLGFALGKLGRWEEAVVEYRLVVEINPKSAVVRYQLGYGLMQLGRWGEAEIELRKAVELYPGSAEVWQQLGDVLRELGKRDEAIAIYQKALEIEPGLAKAENTLKKLLWGESYNDVDTKKSSTEEDNELLPPQTQKTLHSGLPEFGYELISVLPYAYHLHEQKKLKQTISGNDTKPLYFFSPSHVEVKEKRSWSNVQKLQESQFPNIHIHQGQLDWSLFSPPPINEYYQDTAIRFSKPTLVICNRYNSEWEGEPINYINGKMLRQLFQMFHKDYQIVYVNQIFFGVEYEDDAKPMELNEMSIISDFSGDVITLLDIIKLYPQSSINELQCRIYAGCDRFISSNGGFGILCSYFGGENVIFSKMCRELDPSVNSFHAWYPQLSKATISVARTESQLINVCQEKWLEKTPLFNIIIRTSGRPNYFHDCMRSIYEQSHKNVNIIVGMDDQKSLSYVQGHVCTVVTLEKYTGQPQLPPRRSEEYGVWFPYNSYFTQLLEYARVGYIIYLDDDDCFASKDSLAELASKIIETKAELIFWRVLFPDGLIVPCDANWQKRTPVNRDMSGIGFCHTTAVIPTWEPWKRGDYRVAKYLTENTKQQYWFDRIITTTQRKVASGYGKKDDKPYIQCNLNPPLAILIAAFESHDYIEDCLDSIFNQVLPKKCPSLRVLVGVDRCSKTLKLTRKYAPNVEFYFTDKGNFGRYMMRNSLLLKVWRRDSLVLFFDADNIMPPGFLNSYYLKFRYLQDQNMSDNSGECPLDTILHTRFIGISQELIEKAKSYNNLPLTESISKLQSIFTDSTDEFIHICISLMRNSGHQNSEFRIEEMLENYINLKSLLGEANSNAQVKQSAKSDGVFFTLYSTLEKLGFFFISKEGQDQDLFLRAKAMKINSDYDNGLPYFLKRIYPSSLVYSSGEEKSEYIKKVQEETQKRLADGKYVADKKALTLRLLT